MQDHGLTARVLFDIQSILHLVAIIAALATFSTAAIAKIIKSPRLLASMSLTMFPHHIFSIITKDSFITMGHQGQPPVWQALHPEIPPKVIPNRHIRHVEKIDFIKPPVLELPGGGYQCSVM